MKTDREKLIGLIAKCEDRYPCRGEQDCREFKEYLADYLIEHGATIPIRCKDCKHYVHSDTYPACTISEAIVDKDEFCSYGERYWGSNTSEEIADNLIAHGATVQDGKPLEEFLHPIDAYKGLKAKYLVFKADTGKVVDNCFILRPGKDAAAVEALRAYANATDNKTLAEDIYSWVGKGEPAQEWISVKDRLPEIYEKDTDWSVTVLFRTIQGHIHSGYRNIGRPQKSFYDDDWTPPYWLDESENLSFEEDEVTHWMPLPQPPKEERKEERKCIYCGQEHPAEADGTVRVCLADVFPYNEKEPYIDAKHDRRIAEAYYREFCKRWYENLDKFLKGEET